MNKKIYVYLDTPKLPTLVGYLWSRVRGGRESATFEYATGWLKNPKKFSLEPALQLLSGPYHTHKDVPLFGAIGDSAPDRWGRILMRRAERAKAEKDNRPPRTLWEIDFLLGVNDHTRQGALRFSEEENGEFLANDTMNPIPPFVKLPELLMATERVTEDKESANDLILLLAPGSSLGGARPKASVMDTDGTLAIAKFPHQHDEYNLVLWEALALTLAEKSKISVPKWRIEYISNKPVLLLKRFDRCQHRRVPFLSAMSMLNAKDNEARSYLEIADSIRQFTISPQKELHQLWRRIIFNILIANTDDHLRNHAFLYTEAKGWSLSPAYDLNPVPMDIKPRILATTIDYDEATGSIELALEVADYFGLSMKEAKLIINEVSASVSQWQQTAKQLSIPNHEITRMASAFLTLPNS